MRHRILMMTAAILVTGSLVGNSNAVAESSIWEEVPEYFSFSSGVGGWATELQIDDDGSFIGFYHDSEMGDTDSSYPNGTVYLCNFSGKFSEPLRFDQCMYEMDLEKLEIEGNQGDYYIKDGVRYVYSEPYGISGSTQFTLYTPGQPFNAIDEESLWWITNSGVNQSDEYLTCYAICNTGTFEGFVGYEDQQSETKEDEYIFPKSDQEYLTDQDISGMTKEGIQQAINEIYARHGRVFQKSDVAEYFATKSWYHPVTGKTDDQILKEFNDYEKTNVDFLAQYLSA